MLLITHPDAAPEPSTTMDCHAAALPSKERRAAVFMGVVRAAEQRREILMR